MINSAQTVSRGFAPFCVSQPFSAATSDQFTSLMQKGTNRKSVLRDNCIHRKFGLVISRINHQRVYRGFCAELEALCYGQAMRTQTVIRQTDDNHVKSALTGLDFSPGK
ncbi:hypothetical protein [Thalassospira sp.]|uniref:hypothetical protein n=1 Tax=Thalassospira sp. TaxID=1912094 RepID=UPI001B000DA1|nr:hypothetical protein [Thalassospira sp.]MBO6806393.1 hypothetical protein [Thalassospira sp.]MBO6839085.1 hypothetical protein [Thalassospira sp.]